MNIHPIVVHFPIAFLSIYAALEIFTLWYRRYVKTLFNIKAFLLVVGYLGTVAALQTGELAANANRGVSRDLLHMHEAFANGTVWIFGILALLYVGYILWVKNFGNVRTWGDRFFADKPQLSQIVRWKTRAINWLFDTRWLLALMALVGLVVVTVTGALGGAMVYGSDVDPFVQLVVRFLGV